MEGTAKWTEDAATGNTTHHCRLSSAWHLGVCFLTDLTPWSRVLRSASQEIRSRKFITMFTRTCHRSEFWDRWTQCKTPHRVSL